MKTKPSPKTRNYSNGAADTSLTPVLKASKKPKPKHPPKPAPNTYGGVNDR